jgi:hypothetical protein
LKWVFEIGFLELCAQRWLQTLILLISASWVARITGVSNWHQAPSLELELRNSQACSTRHAEMH